MAGIKGKTGIFIRTKEHCANISKSLKGKKLSKEHRDKLHIAKNDIPYKGGICYKRGYKFIFVPFHPHAVNKYVKKSRLVMEKVIGRFLETYEHVHHINGIRNDDRPENLEITTLPVHMKTHRLKNPHSRDNKGRFIT